MRCLSPLVVALLLGVTACSPNTGPTGKGKAGKEGLPPPPCHPGCFPAGTLVATPEGLRPIEALRGGDLVTLVRADGTPTSGAVESTFQTCTRLVEVRTESGSLVTTATQPLCLQEGGFRPAGELAAGDLLWRWEAGERRPARVRGVLPTGREAPVFNLVVGESAVFVAGGFLARGKPPPVAGDTPSAAE
jgi:Hint domain